MYAYKGRVLRVIDGDTVWAEIDLGLDVRIRITLRLEGIDAPEMGTEEGKAAKRHLEELVYEATPMPMAHLLVHTVKDRRERYGRYRAWLIDAETGDNLNERMVTDGHAVAKDYR